MEWHAISEGDLPFTIDQPETWLLLRDDVATVVLRQPSEEAGASFPASVNVVVDESDAVDLAELYDEQLTAMKTALTDFEVVRQTNIAMGAASGTAIEARFRQGIYDIKLDQRYALHDQRAFAVTALADLGSSPETALIIERVLESFRVRASGQGDGDAT